ncbi:hypothetical protein LIP24_10225 [Collinsella aerofaciens]|uniref:hypothetical protein n=1 Tax=Collinsella aerofaciens TaxID=74426 RepID=UPI001D026413|nr:hypothetical protein [Collinsella aerofaciens]MCB5367011.1 hypothetical protein [Collinsella aerofaciens]
MAVIPFAVLSTASLTELTTKAHAATINASVNTLGLGSSFVKGLVPEPFVQLADHINHLMNWFHNLPQEIAEMSTRLMAWLYQLCAELIMKTPIWVFNNQWFSNTTLLFSMLSLGLVTTLTVIESIKRMASGLKYQKGFNVPKAMDFSVIAKRWFIVAGLITTVPWLFQKAFQGLNYLSELLIKMGADTMKAVAFSETMAPLDVLTLAAFDLVLISSIVPVLWQNGKRFFDLIILGVITPLALTAWIFDPYRHLFKQWWSQLKHLSLVQVYHALFLLVLGWFIFGVTTPTTASGIIIKILIVIGGFARMVSPPRIVSKHLGDGKDLGEVTGGVNDVVNKTKKNFETSKAMLGKPVNLIKKAMGKRK